MFMIWSLTTGTDGDHKRWMKHLAMNLHVRRRSLYVCIYICIYTRFLIGRHMQEVRTTYQSTATLMRPSPFVESLWRKQSFAVCGSRNLKLWPIQRSDLAV